MSVRTVIDIHSKGDYPSGALSNFAAYEFAVDGVECFSMEGFLQSLKFRSSAKQKRVCKLVGSQAKKSSRHTFSQLRWRITKTLYWQGKKINRFSEEYQELLDRAYDELGKNEKFKEALIASCGSELIHSIGESNESKTVLTEREFISRLERLRNAI